MPAPAEPWEVDAVEAEPPREEIAHSSMTERDIILEALAEFPDPSETSRTPLFANAAGSAAFRNGDCRGRHRDGYQVQWRECLTKQSTIRCIPILRHVTFLTTLLFCKPFHSPTSLKTFWPSSGVRHGSTPEPAR